MSLTKRISVTSFRYSILHGEIHILLHLFHSVRYLPLFLAIDLGNLCWLTAFIYWLSHVIFQHSVQVKCILAFLLTQHYCYFPATETFSLYHFFLFWAAVTWWRWMPLGVSIFRHYILDLLTYSYISKDDWVGLGGAFYTQGFRLSVLLILLSKDLYWTGK